MPLPGTAHDVVELGEFRLPTKLALYFCRAGDQHRGIAWTTRQFLNRNGVTGDPASRFHHLPNGKTMSIAQVVNHALTLVDSLERQQGGRCQILYVDVVANTSAVWNGIVLAKDFYALAPPQGHVEDEGN